MRTGVPIRTFIEMLFANTGLPLAMVILTLVTSHRHEHANDAIDKTSANADCIASTKRAFVIVIYHVRFFNQLIKC